VRPITWLVVAEWEEVSHKCISNSKAIKALSISLPSTGNQCYTQRGLQ